MGKAVPDDTMDVYLDYIATADRMVACSAEPTDGNDALNVVDLATQTMTPGDGNGDFTIANDTSGRKLTMTAKNACTINHNGTATHVALVLSTGSKLIAVTTCNSQVLTAGGTVDFPTWKINLTDPT